MTSRSKHAVSPEAVQQLERRLKWGALPAVLFVCMMVSLAAVAIYSTFAKPRSATGLPADADVIAARDLLLGRPGVPSTGLRFRSALTGDLAPDARVRPADHARVVAAYQHLERAYRAHPLDPRTLTALGHCELALRHPARAERCYRLALEFTPHYGEARLGLGMALAQRAASTRDAVPRRRLQLEATAQFAAVAEADSAFACALYNRAVLLMGVGREREAERLAQSYFALDPSSPWAVQLRATLANRS
jgi:cytochrome c-type biogenesis protein CcmH/NrfG